MKTLPALIPLALCASALAQPSAPDVAVPIDSVFPSGLEWNSLSGNERSIETRFGTLSLEQGIRCSAEPIWGFELRLAGNTIAPLGCTPDGDYYIVQFKNRFELGDTDLVLLSADAGGSGSPPPRLHLIVLAPGVEPRILMDPGFRSSDWTQRVASDGRELWVDLGFREHRQKRAHFDGATFTVDYVPVQPFPVSRARCENAYQTLGDCSSPARGKDYSAFVTLVELLRAAGDSMSLASHRALRDVSQHPGFDGNAYVRTCVAFIASGSKPDYVSFETAVCAGAE